MERDPASFVIWDHDADTLAVEFGEVAAFWKMNSKGEHVRSEFLRNPLGKALRVFEIPGEVPLRLWERRELLRYPIAHALRVLEIPGERRGHCVCEALRGDVEGRVTGDTRRTHGATPLECRER